MSSLRDPKSFTPEELKKIYTDYTGRCDQCFHRSAKRTDEERKIHREALMKIYNTEKFSPTGVPRVDKAIKSHMKQVDEWFKSHLYTPTLIEERNRPQIYSDPSGGGETSEVRHFAHIPPKNMEPLSKKQMNDWYIQHVLYLDQCYRRLETATREREENKDKSLNQKFWDAEHDASETFNHWSKEFVRMKWHTYLLELDTSNPTNHPDVINGISPDGEPIFKIKDLQIK